MKKLMTLMLGLAFLTATVSTTFAQDTATKKSKRSKGKKAPKGDTSKSGSKLL